MSIRILIKWSALFVLLVWPLLYLSISVNDDAFVYFNYAKNFVEGNYFAYDSRLIPSEGFTSLLYLLLLVPFQSLKISMPFSAFVVNLGSLLLASLVVCRIYGIIAPNKSQDSWVAGGFFLILSYLDKNVVGLVGWGFESILNLFLFLTLVWKFLEAQSDKTVTKFGEVLIVYAFCILVRPENALVCSPWVLASFWHVRQYRSTWYTVLMFFVGGVGCLFGKQMIFHDVVPTGFYRKINPEAFNLSYLFNYLKNYVPQLVMFFFILWGITFQIKKKDGSHGFSKAILCLLGSLTFLFLFSTKVNPLVGVYYRYLILFTGSMALVLSLFFTYLSLNRFTVKISLVASLPLFLLLFGMQRYRNNPLSLYRESEALLDQHPYVQFARFLQQKNPKPTDITIMFGDAGAIPYFFDCKFVDINGLTEPYLAKMFLEKNQKVEKINDYIKRNEVDLAVLAVEGGGLNLNLDSQYLPHGALNKPDEYRKFLKNQKESGFAYIGSVNGIDYTLHFGARKNSRHYAKLRKDLEEYVSSGHGYLLKTDLVVKYTEGDVVFENDADA